MACPHKDAHIMIFSNEDIDMELCDECTWEGNFFSQIYHLRSLRATNNLRLGMISVAYQ